MPIPDNFDPNLGTHIGPGWRAFRDLAADGQWHKWEEAFEAIKAGAPKLSEKSIRPMLYWAHSWGLIEWEGKPKTGRIWRQQLDITSEDWSR